MEDRLFEEVKSFYTQNEFQNFFKVNSERIQKTYDIIQFDEEIKWENFKFFEAEIISTLLHSVDTSFYTIPQLSKISHSVLKNLNDETSSIKISPYRNILNIGERVTKSKNCFGIKYESWTNLVDKEDYNKIALSFHQTITPNLINFYIDSDRLKIEFNFNYHSMDSSEFFLRIKSEDKLLEIKATKEGNTFNFDCLNKNSSKTYETKEIITYQDGKIKRLQKNQNKHEDLYNYSENSYEEYEHLKEYSYGKKSYNNSMKRKFYEEWKEYHIDHGHEIKISRYLDDGFGLITKESLGHREKEGKRSYEFNDITYHNLSNGEITTVKKGYDEENEWESKYTTNQHGHQVENWGKNKQGNEWYEKWFEGQREKYSYKRGKNNKEKWEEEWRSNSNDSQVENFCKKKCETPQEEWLETWSEIIQSTSKPEKTCYKMNIRNGIKTEFCWGDVKDKHLNQWLHYYEHKENDTQKNYRKYNY